MNKFLQLIKSLFSKPTKPATTPDDGHIPAYCPQANGSWIIPVVVLAPVCKVLKAIENADSSISATPEQLAPTDPRLQDQPVSTLEQFRSFLKGFPPRGKSRRQIKH